MAMQLKIHYDNYAGFHNPYLAIQLDSESKIQEHSPSGQDHFGFIYEMATNQSISYIRFKDGASDVSGWEDERLLREYSFLTAHNTSQEIWCKGYNAFVYPVEPSRPEPQSSADFLNGLSFKPEMY